MLSRSSRRRGFQPDLDLDVYTEDPTRPPYHMKTNSQGFRNDREFHSLRNPANRESLNLGDSFSVGYGVDQERFTGSSWSRGGARNFRNAQSRS